MLTNTSRAGRLNARLNLESLEARTLLSATLPAMPTAPLGPVAHSTSVQVNHQSVSHATVNFSYRWGMGPFAVLTGTNSSTQNGRSTGQVDFALVRPGPDATTLGGAATAVPLGFVVTNSSASASNPDQFNTSFTLHLRISDANGTWGQLNFQGTVTGTLTADTSNLTVKFQSPTTQQLTLGNHVYTVSVPQTIHPSGPADAPSAVYAFVSVRSR